MTEEQIIKAWGQKVTPVQMGRMQIYDAEILCSPELVKDTLSLLNRQKAEIERLRNKPEFLGVQKRKMQVEAIKEFAERLKDMYRHNTTSITSLVTLFDNINNLVAEMTEENHDE